MDINSAVKTISWFPATPNEFQVVFKNSSLVAQNPNTGTITMKINPKHIKLIQETQKRPVIDDIGIDTQPLDIDIDAMLDEIENADNNNNNNVNANANADAVCTNAEVIAFLQSVKCKNREKLRAIIGDPDQQRWQIKECGGGNVNYVYTVSGNRGSVVIKHAAPFVRLVGPSMRLHSQRLFFEYDYNRLLTENCASIAHITGAPLRMYELNARMKLCVMENLCAQPRNMTVYNLEFGQFTDLHLRYPSVGEHLGLLMAHQLFKTSDLYLHVTQKWRELRKYCANYEMPVQQELSIFEGPCSEQEHNLLKVQTLLDTEKYGDVGQRFYDSINRCRSDYRFLCAVYTLLEKYRTVHQCLCHGDLHTGSVMVNHTETLIFDHEFAFYGPFALDVGTMVGNFALGVFAQQLYDDIPPDNEDDDDDDDDDSKTVEIEDGNDDEADNKSQDENANADTNTNTNTRQQRRIHRKSEVLYLCAQAEIFWNTFERTFLELWQSTDKQRDDTGANVGKGNGGVFPSSMMANPSLKQKFRVQYVYDSIYKPMIKYAALIILRRILGLADADEYRVDDKLKVFVAQEKAVRFAHDIMVENIKCATIEEFTEHMLRYL